MYQIRKTTVGAAAALAALGLLALPASGAGDHAGPGTEAYRQTQQLAQGQGYGMGSGMMGQGYGMGPGMMGPGYGMGPGMMGPGFGMGPGMMGPGQGFGMRPGFGGQPMLGRDLSVEDVRHMLDHRLEWTGNARLKVGDVQGLDDDTILAEILTVDGSLVERIRIDRHTGLFQREE